MFQDNLFRELVVDNFAGGGARSGKLCGHCGEEKNCDYGGT